MDTRRAALSVGVRTSWPHSAQSAILAGDPVGMPFSFSKWMFVHPLPTLLPLRSSVLSPISPCCRLISEERLSHIMVAHRVGGYVELELAHEGD